MESDTGTWEDEDGVKRDYAKTLYVEIPLAEFEHLHAEVKRIHAGWQDAEAAIAKLNVMLTHEVGFREQAERDADDLRAELQAADQRIKELDAANERLMEQSRISTEAMGRAADRIERLERALSHS